MIYNQKRAEPPESLTASKTLRLESSVTDIDDPVLFGDSSISSASSLCSSEEFYLAAAGDGHQD